MNFVVFGLAARFAAGSALSCAFLGAAFAQPNPAQSLSTAALPAAPTLSQAAEAAWQRASQRREAEGQAQRAVSERAAASSLWAAPPALELSYRDDRWQTSAGRRETEVGLAWPLWLPGQRNARGAAVESDIELAQAAALAGRLHFAGLVREAAWGIASQQADAALADAQVRSLQEIADDVRRRVKAGDLAHSDVLAADSEALAAQSAQLATRHRLATTEAHWKTLTGMSQLPDLAQTESAGMPIPGFQSAQPFNVEAHPDARLAALAVERARKRLDVIAATRRDPPELLLRLRQDVPGRGESARHSIGVGVRIPLGTEGRNQPLQAAALSELNIAQTQQQRTEERLTADAAIAQAAVQTALQQLETDRQRSVLLQERATLIERSFKAGETPLPDLLRAHAAAAQAHTSFARQQVALGLARARLHQAFGILP